MKFTQVLGLLRYATVLVFFVALAFSFTEQSLGKITLAGILTLFCVAGFTTSRNEEENVSK